MYDNRVMARTGILTDNHIDLVAGKSELLSGNIQEFYGITKDEAERQIRSFEERNKDYRPSSDG